MIIYLWQKGHWLATLGVAPCYECRCAGGEGVGNNSLREGISAVFEGHYAGDVHQGRARPRMVDAGSAGALKLKLTLKLRWTITNQWDIIIAIKLMKSHLQLSFDIDAKFQKVHLTAWYFSAGEVKGIISKILFFPAKQDGVHNCGKLYWWWGQ